MSNSRLHAFGDSEQTHAASGVRRDCTLSLHPTPPASGEGESRTSRTIQVLDSTARTILGDVESEALKLENEGCEDIIALAQAAGVRRTPC